MSMLEKLRPWLRDRIGIFPLAPHRPAAAVAPDTDPGTALPVKMERDTAIADCRIRRNWLYRSGPWQQK